MPLRRMMTFRPTLLEPMAPGCNPVHPGCNPVHPGCNPVHPGASQHAAHRAERCAAHVPPHLRGRLFCRSTPAFATDHSGPPQRLACSLRTDRAVPPRGVASGADETPSAASASSNCWGTDACGGLQAPRGGQHQARGCLQYLSAGYRDTAHPCQAPACGRCCDAATDGTAGVADPGAARDLSLTLTLTLTLTCA